MGVSGRLDLPARGLGLDLQVERGNVLLVCGNHRMTGDDNASCKLVDTNERCTKELYKVYLLYLFFRVLGGYVAVMGGSRRR